MDRCCHVCQLELGVLEGTNGLAKLLPTMYIVQCHVSAELGAANTAAGYVDPATVYCSQPVSDIYVDASTESCKLHHSDGSSSA